MKRPNSRTALLRLQRNVNVSVDITWTKHEKDGQQIVLYQFFDRNNEGKELSPTDFLALWGINSDTIKRYPNGFTQDQVDRAEAMLLLNAGLKPEYVAWAFRKSPRWADELNRDIARQLKTTGVHQQFIRDRRGGNSRPRKFTTPEIVDFVAELLGENPKLTGPQLGALVAKRFGFPRVPPQRVSDILKLVKARPASV